MITYDDLAGGLEDAWLAAGLHEHAVVESTNPDALERTYRVEIFPEHPEPLTESIAPPWVELTFNWSAAHQLFAERREIPPGVLELAWTYTVDVRNHTDRPDLELVRAFNLGDPVSWSEDDAMISCDSPQLTADDILDNIVL